VRAWADFQTTDVWKSPHATGAAKPSPRAFDPFPLDAAVGETPQSAREVRAARHKPRPTQAPPVQREVNARARTELRLDPV
jgi:hypothetical protein